MITLNVIGDPVSQPKAKEPKDLSHAPDAPKPAPEKKKGGKLEDKWGKTIVAVGYTMIPNILIQRQRTLGLTPTHVNILLQLLMYWWEDDNLPHPTKKRLAESMGLSESTVQRNLRQMEQMGFLKRIFRKQEKNRNLSNQYDLSLLRHLLEPQAEEEFQLRKAQRDSRRKRQSTVNKVKPASESSQVE